MKKNLRKIAKFLVSLLVAVGLLLPALPARAESIQFDGTTVSFWLPPGYNILYQTMEHEGTWGEKTVTWKDYDYHGTRVVQTVTFPDDSRDARTGDEIDGVGFGGGVLYIRGDTDIRIEAEKYQKPYVEGVIYKEGAITVPGDGVSYPGYYYLSSRTEKEEGKWEWVYTKHNVALRIALTQTEPLHSLWLHFWTWGPADFTDSKGVRYTFKLDGKPVKDTHREYLNRILSSVSISGWKAPTPTPVTTPAPAPVAAPTLDQSQTSTPGNTGLEGDWWLSQGFIPSRPTLTSVEVYIGSVHANLSYPLTLQVRGDRNGLPSGSVLASISVTITKKGWGWITFDIPDLQVNPGTKYHLVLASETNYHVGLDSTNPYSYGSMGYTTDAGVNWKLLHDTPNYDMAFKIYGTGQPPTPAPTAVPTPPGRIETMVQPLVQLAEESPHLQLLETNYKASLSPLRRNLENLKWAEEQHEYYQKQPTRSWLEAQARGYNVAFWRHVISNLVKTMYQQLNTLEGFMDSARSIGAPISSELDSQWQEARGTLDIARARYDIGMPAPELEEVPVELEEVPVKLEEILVELEEVPVRASFLSQRHNSLVTNIKRLREDRVQLHQSQQELLTIFTEQGQVKRMRNQSQRLTTEYERWGKEIERDRTAFVGHLRDFAIDKLIPGASTAHEVLARTEPPSLNLAEQLRWSTVRVMETCVTMAHEAEQLPPQERITKMASLLTTIISPAAPPVGVVSDVLSLLELALDAQKAFLDQDVITELDRVHWTLETSLAYSEWNLRQLIETHDEIDEQEEDLKVELEEIEVELEEIPVELEEIEVEYELITDTEYELITEVEGELYTEILELYQEIKPLHDAIKSIQIPFP